MCLASQNWIDCDCQIQLANGPWCKIWINRKIRVFSFVHCNFLDLWASFVSLFPSCFSDAIFECYWRHLACSTFLRWIFQMFLYTDLCPPNYVAISIKICCMHLTISHCDWIVKNEDLNQWTYWWFLKMACVLYRCLDFDADWGETIPYEGRYGPNHFSTIYCV